MFIEHGKTLLGQLVYIHKTHLKIHHGGVKTVLYGYTETERKVVINMCEERKL